MYVCLRCKTPQVADRCRECGKHKDRPVRSSRRQRPIGGKRGRNSGTTSKAKNKKN